MREYGPPINLAAWVRDNEHLLRPPVGNQQVWKQSDLLITLVCGPKERTDFHDDPLEEFFYQLKGQATLLTDLDSNFEAISLGMGDIYLLVPQLCHSTQRLRS